MNHDCFDFQVKGSVPSGGAEDADDRFETGGALIGVVVGGLGFIGAIDDAQLAQHERPQGGDDEVAARATRPP